jgi:hypothetical protein
VAITKEERTIAHILRTPSIAVSAIEGFYDGDRAVFLCIPSDDGEGKGEVTMVPVAMLLREEDIKKVSRPAPAPTIIKPGEET